MQENKNIHKVIHLIPSDGVGGVEIAARSMVEASQLNCDFDLVLIAGNSCIGNSERVSISPFRSENNPFAHYHAIKTIFSINPDVLVCSLWRSIPVGLVVKLVRPQIKLVFFLHCISTIHLLERCFSWLMLCFCDAVWGDSSETISSRIGTRTHLLTRVISFVTTNNSTNLKKNKLCANFVFWGRLHNQKGLDRSVKLIQMLVEKEYDVKFQIWGRDDGEQSRLTTQINNEGLEKFINFMGTVEHSELDRISEKNTFYLQLSRMEGMAMSVVEAMQRALVPVVTPVGEIRKYCIDDENAILVDDVDELDSVADRIISLLHNEDKYRIMQESTQETWANKRLYAADFCMAAIELLEEHS